MWKSVILAMLLALVSTNSSAFDLKPKGIIQIPMMCYDLETFMSEVVAKQNMKRIFKESIYLENKLSGEKSIFRNSKGVLIYTFSDFRDKVACLPVTNIMGLSLQLNGKNYDG